MKNPQELKKVEGPVEKKVKELVDKLKASHAKFEDPDFGPQESDEFGAKALYGEGKPDPAGSKYPAPESLKWERPQYDDSTNLGSGEEKEKGDNDEEDDEDEDEDEFGGYGGNKEEDNVSPTRLVQSRTAVMMISIFFKWFC